MARQEVNIGVEGNDGTGDSIRESFRKTNENFSELYAVFGQGGTIRFTSLSDTPNELTPNTIALVNDAGTQVQLAQLASNSALDETKTDTITFSYDVAGKLIISTAFTELADDQSPSLNASLYANNKGIAGVAITTQAAEDFLAEHGVEVSIDDLVISKGYADRRYITSGLPIRIAEEPSTVTQYTLTVSRYINNQVEVPSHGYDSGLNGTPYVFQAEDTDPTNLTSGTTYYIRFVDEDNFTLHSTQEGAASESSSEALATQILVSGTIEENDIHTLTDAAYDTQLQGNFLDDVALPRKSIVRRQGDDMTGALYLHDHPGELAGEGAPNGKEDLQAATKYYVDNTSYSSPTNLFVSTEGDDLMAGVPSGKEGTSFTYAYRTINAAAQRAYEMVKTAKAEPGPYFQTVTKDNGDAFAPVITADVDSPVWEQTRFLIEQNREYVIQELTGFLSFTYPTFTYNTETCQRDTGLILDAVALDINRGTNANFLTRQAAERYYSNSSARKAITSQLTETVAGFEFVRDLVEVILSNDLYREKSITDISRADKGVVTTSTNHDLEDGNIVYFKDIGGMTQIEGEKLYAKVLTDQTFELFTDVDLISPYDTSTYNGYTTGGRLGVVYQIDEDQYFDAADSDAIATSAVVAKFNLLNNIIQNGIDAGADTVYGSTYKLVLDNGAGTYIDQGNPDNTDVLPGKVIVGVNSGAVGRVVSLTTNDGTESNNDTVQMHLLEAKDFEVGEPVKYGNFVKQKQITIFIESGIYEEDYPIRLANNVSIKGDEFRRVIIRPKDRVSQSPTTGVYFFRDKEFDDIPVATEGEPFFNQNNELQGYFGYHYLSTPSLPINIGSPITNLGGYRDAAQILEDNKDFIIKEVTAWIDDNQPSLTYDETKCRRDIEYIYQAVALDIALGTNYNAVTAGLAYQRANAADVQGDQKDATIASIRYAGYLAENIFEVESNDFVKTRVRNAFREVVDILDNGEVSTDDAADTLKFDTPTTLPSTLAEEAKDQLQANRDFAIAEVTQYIDDNYPALTYDVAKCERDVGYIVDALSHDVLYGGDFASIVAARSYFVDGVSQLGAGEGPATIDAYNYLDTILQDIVQGNAIAPLQVDVAQDTTTYDAAGATEATAVSTNIAHIIGVITAGNLSGLAAETLPSITWADDIYQDAYTAIIAETSTVQDSVVDFIDDNFVNFTYNVAKCERDTGLIVDALVNDLTRGGEEGILEAQGEYYYNYISKFDTSGGFFGQEAITRDSLGYISTIAGRLLIGSYTSGEILQDTGAADYEAPDLRNGSSYSTWAADTFYVTNDVVQNGANFYRCKFDHTSVSTADFNNTQLWVQVSSPVSVTGNLVTKLIFAFQPEYNPPKRNDEMDVFLMSDATIVRNVTVQGHGGFMCVLDPEGQILTKSPYIQTASSFSKSENQKRFRGGMYVDAFVGNIPAYIPQFIDPDGGGDINGKVDNFTLWIRSKPGQGLFIRPPELPCPFYVEGRRYQVNAISDYDSGNGWVKLYLDRGSNDGDGYDETQFADGLYYRDLFLQTAGNRSILGNDFTQINDLGYGLVTNNGALSEMVSMFTYYCQVAYYANNGSEIRSTNGSNGYGNFGLVAEGADPNEIPDQVTLRDPMVQPCKAFTTTTYTNAFDEPSIYVTDLQFTPSAQSLITIYHPVLGQTLNYVIQTVSNISDLDNDGVLGESGDVVNSGVETVTNVGAADPSRAAGTYEGVSATGGSGSGATFNVTVSGGGAAIVTVNQPGSGYLTGETLTIADADLGAGGGAALTFDTDSIYGGTLGAGTFSNAVYKLDLRADDVQADDFFGTLQETVTNGTLIEYRNNYNHIFAGTVDPARLVTRPSTAINFDESDNVTYRSVAFVAADGLSQPIGADEIQTTFEIGFDFVNMEISTANLGGGQGSAQGDTQIAIAELEATDQTRLVRDIAGREPGDAGYSGGMIFVWEGKTHQVTDYTAQVGYALIDISDVASTNINSSYSGSGLNAGIPASVRDLYAGLPSDATAEITIAISLCRATGHDFTQIGTGGFNDSNYPNVILGDPENSLAEFYTDSPEATTGQVWERRKGRVFWMSTDQYGFFRVGKFFSVDQATGDITFAGEIGLSNANSLGFKKGVTISEFSADDSMADESGEAVPTEKAVVNYINRRLGYNSGGQVNPAPLGNRIGPGAMMLNGDSAMEGTMDMGANQITNLGLPLTDGTAATNKNYVDARVREYDSIDKLRNIEFNNVAEADLILATGKRRVIVSPPSGGVWAAADTITVGSKSGLIIDIESVTDNILGSASDAYAVTVVTYNVTGTGDFAEGETLTNGTATASVLEDPVDEFANASEATASDINVTVSRTASGAEFNFQYEALSLENADVSESAAIAQSKLAMNTAGTRANATGIAQSDLGLATFKNTEFTHTSGFVELQTSSSTSTGIAPGKLQHQATDTVLGRSAAGDGAVSAISFSTVLDEGGAVTDGDFPAYTGSSNQALIRTAQDTYSVTNISDGAGGSTIAKRKSTGAIQANSYIIGGDATYEILTESSGTLTLKTPAQGTILSAVGGGVTPSVTYPIVKIPGKVDVGNTAISAESTFQSGSSYTGESFVATDWIYTKFIEASNERDASSTGIALGDGGGFTDSAADTILLITGGSERLTVNDTTVTVKQGLVVDGSTNLKGTVTIGDASSDLISVNGRFNTNLLPSTDNAINIGQGGGTPLRINTVHAVTFSGTATTARYADLAEKYLADAAYEPGTVLVLGGDAEVTTTKTKGDKRVAGVVSTNPAYLMNSELEGDNVVEVALAGRVPCKVFGTVAKGDILVASAVPGYAMVDNNPGVASVLGKAVEEKLDSGKGVIEIVVGRA